MNWLDRDEANPKITYTIQKKTLTITAVDEKISMKTIKTNKQKSEESLFQTENNSYSIADQKKISNYFEMVQEMENYCKEAFIQYQERFSIFSKHPKYGKLLRKIRSKFNEN